jgi:tRNA (uracil-5-)-methyltransferase TRM9
MDSIADGSLGIDAGTGNGKYLPLHLDRHGSVRTIGLDRSRNLLAFARCAGIQAPGIVMHDVVLGDVVDQPWRPGVFVRRALLFKWSTKGLTCFRC